MFSVNNFYTIFNSYYSWPEKNNSLYLFLPHGTKDWHNMVIWGQDNPGSPESRAALISNRGAFLMHDQEPFSFEYLQYYKQSLSDPLKVKEYSSIHSDSAIQETFQYLSELSTHIDDITFSHLLVQNTKVPIICHSEKNSKDIQKLVGENNENLWVDCYYWWHGMVARDWFRHWERHNALSVKNKAHCDYRFLIYSRDHTGTREYRTKVINHLLQYQDQINYNWNGDYRCSSLSASINIEDANNSAIHLIAETLFDTEKIYLTEKVFKPMIMSQPFILFGPPGSLQYLRDYGFKTFDHVWSEDYDLIVDANERQQAILSLIDTLAAMDAVTFNELYQKTLPIINHNRKYFYSVEFQDLLWDELQKNCSEALLKQQELSEHLPGGTLIYAINKCVEKTSTIGKIWQQYFPIIADLCNAKSQIINRYPNLAKLI